MSFPNPDNYGKDCDCGPENSTPPVPSDIDARLTALEETNDVIVSGSDIASLTTAQQDLIHEGSIVVTTDGRRWVYSGTGSKVLEASYIVLSDVSSPLTFTNGGTITMGTNSGSINTSATVGTGGSINTSSTGTASGGNITTTGTGLYNGGSIITASSIGAAGGSINTSASLTSAGGSINISGGSGSGGSITSTDGGGSIDLSSYGGSITSTGYGGSLIMSGYGGSIDTSTYGGSIDTSTYGGSIDTSGYNGTFIGGAINTSATNIGSGGSINTSNKGGSIDISGTATFSGGSINLSATQTISSGKMAPHIVCGSGVPSASLPDGSLFLRVDGTASTTLYVRAAGAWTALS